jgi:hypothetical protein
MVFVLSASHLVKPAQEVQKIAILVMVQAIQSLYTKRDATLSVLMVLHQTPQTKHALPVIVAVICATL